MIPLIKDTVSHQRGLHVGMDDKFNPHPPHAGEKLQHRCLGAAPGIAIDKGTISQGIRDIFQGPFGTRAGGQICGLFP